MAYIIKNSGVNVVFSFFILLSFLSTTACHQFRYLMVSFFSPHYETEGKPTQFVPQFSEKDQQRSPIHIRLTMIANGFEQPTDFHFVPNQPHILLVLQQKGRLIAVDLKENTRKELLQLNVLSQSEQGLLGLAFHPEFIKNGKFYLSTVIRDKGKDLSDVSEWVASEPLQLMASHFRKNKVILQLAQPFQNHNGGSLAFGPDGMLYIGFGDGGYANDPYSHGQNPKTLLGTLLRLDVSQSGTEKEAYRIPKDNPYVNHKENRPEIWAMGFRNPWKFSFTPEGQLVVGDVGQYQWEEIDLVERGKNYGWAIMEGHHCFDPKKGCITNGLTAPIYEYGREDGASIIGGYVYTGHHISQLKHKYVFGDFVSGRIWAISLPKESGSVVTEVSSLGKWPVLISSFGQDGQGELYLSDYGAGSIFKLVMP